MPILNSEPERPGVRRMLLGAGLGGAFGLQACRLAISFSGNTLPRFGLAWILASHALLGIILGATAGLARWWQRGLPLGLLFALPCATFTYAIGFRWVGAAGVVAEALAGLLIALLVDVIMPKARPASRVADARPARKTGSAEPTFGPSATDIRRRLSEGEAELERLDTERQRRGDPRLGKTAEDRIIWGELLELELQDIDERVSRTGNADGGAGPRRGEPQERDDS
jgi:hypothetical protein